MLSRGLKSKMVNIFDYEITFFVEKVRLIYGRSLNTDLLVYCRKFPRDSLLFFIFVALLIHAFFIGDFVAFQLIM